MKFINSLLYDYWSCTKFADFIRGTKKPLAFLTGEEWTEWHKLTKSKNKVRYYLAEELLDSIQKIIKFPFSSYSNIKYYIINRWVDKSHCLSFKDCKLGSFYELGYRFLHCCFDEFANYVETRGFESLELNKHYDQIDLYNWWVKERPLRVNEFERAKVECDPSLEPHSLFEKPINITEGELSEYYRFASDIEEYYYEEDTRMLCKLMSMRGYLW